ncbi:hypothetical protein PVAND_000808 [Polypedilum vanderplanki]|uniref:Uncharacterized protein n=1 Tax=Polypedilum vanderplanki TaxID=319348 RepID=A0A9J6BLB0_POLVA|nr:hypothetical protein PVAND_000808 [Polypedilum vanderplanki]
MSSGRGRGFSVFSAKSSEDGDDQKSDESSSVVKQTSSGRGRALSFQPASTDSDGASTISQIPFTGRGAGRGLGRGFVGISTKSKSSGSEPTESKKESTSEDQFKDISPKKLSSSGRGGEGSGSGRGLSSSGRGLTSGFYSEERSGEHEITAGLQTMNIQAEQQPPTVLPQRSTTALAAEASAQRVEPEVDLPTVMKHGRAGKAFDSITNCITIKCNKDSGVFEYEVRFQPEIDNMRLRGKYLAQLKDVIGSIKTFDGVTLYLPKKLEENNIEITTSLEGGEEVKIKFIFRRQKRLAECVHLYNVLFERIMGILNYQRVGRKSFDPTSPKIITQHKLEVWPGFVKSVEEHEGGLMLLLDVSHRVLSQKTVLEFFKECIQKTDNWKDMAKKGVVGNIVLTRYNNKSYRIDDIDFSQNPLSTFKKGDREISYADYYKNEYNIKIQDLKQPLLISRKEMRVSGEKKKLDFVVCLVPELCFLTGLSDEMRSNYNVMKDLASFTKLTPFQRVEAYRKYVTNIANNEKASALLSGWGLELDKDPTRVTARLLDEEFVVFGNKKEFSVGPQADFGRHATSNQVLEPIKLQNWLIIYVNRDVKTADAFEEMVRKVSGPTGINCANPRRIELGNDRTDTYVNEIRKQLNDKYIQMVVTIFPSLRDDRYAAVKKILCAECPCPSQCINSRTLRNDAKNRSIVQKILLQMNCKLGGSLWGIKIPLKDSMIIGIDTYHEASHKGLTVGGFVASLNSSFTKYFSKPAIQQKREELINGLLNCMSQALLHYKTENNSLPEKIIIYRDGVGDGQLQYVESYEIPQFEDACRKMASNYNPKLTFIVVQKRINHKFFKVARDAGKETLVNPPPGSVLDNTITRRTFCDFFLCSQHVREGTTTPTHYIVLRDDNNYNPDIVQRLTYKLCFMYYNWVGTVRVPAPCQYAHKLAYLVGLAIKRQVDDSLLNKLFYL